MDTTANKATMQEIALSLIDITRNPRRYFDQAELDVLVQSVRSNGVQTPILVRPSTKEGRYELIAGERRVRASRIALGEDAAIPARIQAMTDEEADRAALIENTVRADMSATEESDAAHRVTEACLGNRDEACKLLGWKRAKLDSRLALQNLCEKVKEALDTRQIKLGHAELLAATPLEKQEAALAFILEQKPSVEEVRSMMEQFALNLKTAIFDKTDCTNCAYNSAQQSTLFESSVSDGHCTNKPCFESKTNAKLISVQGELQEVYPTVKITDSPSSLGAIKVTVEYVGKDQIAGCKTCENYGAVVSSNASDIGATHTSLCFDSVCFGKKRSEFKAKKANPVDNTDGNSDALGDESEVDTDSGNEEQEPEKIAKPRTKAKDAEKTQGDSGGDSKAKSEKADSFSPENTKDMTISNKTSLYRREIWNAIFAQYFVKNPENAKRVFMALVLRGELVKPMLDSEGKAENWVAGQAGCFINQDGENSSVDKHGSNGLLILAKENLSEQQISRLASFMVATKVKHSDTKEEWLATLAESFNVRYSDYTKVDRAFFDTLTKFEIQAVCYEAGYEPSDESLTFSALMSKKKGEIIETLFDGSFDWSGFTPAMLVPCAKKWTLVPKQVAPAA